VLGVWLLAGSAHAGLWQGQAELELDFAGVTFEAGFVSLTEVGLTRLDVPGATFVGTQHVIVSAPPATGGNVSVSNGAGRFTGDPLVGTMPVRGGYSLTGFGGLVLFSLPLAIPAGPGPVTAGLGVGGTIMGTAGADPVTATFGPWSSGSVTIANVATPGGTGTITRTGAIIDVFPAVIQLVSPVRIVSTLGPPTGSFATLTYELERAPEPTSSALLALGTAVLVVAARRKRR